MTVAASRLFVALDLPTLAEAEALVDRLGPSVRRVKVGLELFCAHGAAAVRAFSGTHEVFLDLKLHDIPETVRRAAAVASSQGARFLTVHASGGRAMLEAAVRGAGASCAVLAVTVLTSLEPGDLTADGHDDDVAALVVRRARLAIDVGCAGIVCSPREAQLVRAAVGPTPMIVTPGVRPAGAAAGDQKRVATARQSIDAGASAVVVGRPIRDAADPKAALAALLAELA